MVHSTGPKMTHESATAVAEIFRGLGFGDVRLSEFGYEAGRWEVHIWIVNSRAGNRNLFVVDHVPASGREAAILAKQARGKASKADSEALSRMAAERALDAE